MQNVIQLGIEVFQTTYCSQQDNDLQAEIARLKKQLKRAEQERDILKEAARFFANESKNDTHS